MQGPVSAAQNDLLGAWHCHGMTQDDAEAPKGSRSVAANAATATVAAAATAGAKAASASRTPRATWTAWATGATTTAHAQCSA